MGEQVLVESDKLTAIRLQKYHGGWLSKMEQVASLLFPFCLVIIIRKFSNPFAAALKLEQFHSLVA